jgi:23S rRNA (uracil1939-C5)-methyltransferase
LPPPTRKRAEPVELAIARIGDAGDGIAPAGDGTSRPINVARTLPGERVRVQPALDKRRADLVELLASSPDRIDPPCPHFVQGCGGCALQHWADEAYAAWKRTLVVAALIRAGFAAPAVAPLLRTPPRSRRRMDLAILRRDHGVDLGLHRTHAAEIVDMAQCEVLDPRLLALVAPLRRTLSGLAALRRSGSLVANLLAEGADLLIRTDGPLAPTDRAKLAEFARAHGVPRISWALGTGTPEPACLLATPHVLFGNHRVEPPPGAFLQATGQGEATIVAAVCAGLPQRLTGRSFAIELYAGCGTLSFPLAARLRVRAFEGDAAAAACLRRAQAGTRVEATQRDLARQPLSAAELSGAAAIILDPPHAGAAPQIAAVAASGAKRVIYVSCNPAALATDATALAQAGYHLLTATPIDQFLWSAQVECVAVFARP